MSDDVDGGKSTPLSRTFQEHEITAIPFEKELFVTLTQLERAWGYARFGLSKQLARWERKGQMREGVHYRKLQNGKLASFKTAAGIHFANCEVDPKASHVLVVTERGLYRLLTLIPDKAIAIAFQDWLETEVLPAINRTGRYDPPPPEGPPPAAPGAARPAALPGPSQLRARRVQASPPPLGSPTQEMLRTLRELHRAKQLPDACFHALKVVVELLDRNAAAPPPPVPSPSGGARPPDPPPRRLTGSVESSGEARERKIAEAMRATNPQGSQAEGPMFNAVASCLFYTARHQADFAAGTITAREYSYLLLQKIRGWSEWRVATGDLDFLGLLAEVREVVERFCGPVPGLE